MRISNPQVFGGGKLITVAETNERIAALKTSIEATLTGPSGTLSLNGYAPLGEDKKVPKEFLPQMGVDLYFNNQVVASGVTDINFAGTVELTRNEDGSVKVQIGENQNSSSWNTADGIAPATVANIATNNYIIPDATGAAFKIGNWTPGQQYKCTKSNSISFKSAGNVHFDIGNNEWKVVVFDADGTTKLVDTTITTVVAGDSTGTVTGWTDGTPTGTGASNVTYSLAGKANEKNYPSAVGGMATPTFTFNLANILPNGGRFKVSIVGCGGSFTSPDMFYINGETPAIASVDLTLANAVEKQVSGVKYVAATSTVTYTTGDITNLNNQAGVTNKLTVTGTGVSVVKDITSANLTGYTNAWNNVPTFTATRALSGSYKGTSVTVNVTPENAFAKGTQVSKTLANVNVNTYAETASTDASETFLTEGKRLKSDLTSAWDSSATLVGGTDLQVIPGEGLVYPTTNYSAIATPAGNPNYSGMTGTKYFYRKFIAGSGTVFGGTIEMAGLGAAFNNAAFTAELSIDNGATWYNLKDDRGGANPLGIKTGYAGSKVSFSYPGTTSSTAANGVLIKIGWSDALKTTKISSITVTLK
ncbi:MAG: hypothetical protein J6C46_00325 [Clostridia bacterium]|nr:hypothetical protein [Clostridia bacterium]